MRALEESKAWFETAGKPVFEKLFGSRFERVAVGLAGHGSECFGFDDDISHDHDYRIGFALWVTEEDDREFGVELQKAYQKLRRDFPPPDYATQESRFGEAEHGVCIIGDFYRRHIGLSGAPQEYRDWLNIPEYAFAEAVNGEVFYDKANIFSSIRKTILYNMPEDVRLKKLAARAAVMAQSGQYNFARCLAHNEPGAAALALSEFVQKASSMIFLLNFRFAPYYKWVFRAMRSLEKLSDMSEKLQMLLTGNFDAESKKVLIEEISAAVIAELSAQGLTAGKSDYLEDHALEITRRIRSHEIRSMHIMEG